MSNTQKVVAYIILLIVAVVFGIVLFSGKKLPEPITPTPVIEPSIPVYPCNDGKCA